MPAHFGRDVMSKGRRRGRLRQRANAVHKKERTWS